MTRLDVWHVTFVVFAILLIPTQPIPAADADPDLSPEQERALQLEIRMLKLDRPAEIELGLRRADPDRSRESGFRALYTMDRDGSNVEFLVAAPGMVSSATPEWSHDGTMVAFDATHRVEMFQKSRVYVYVDKGPFRGDVHDLGYGNVPTWSPDDRRIAFMLNPGNPAGVRDGVWVMNEDGTNREWLCDGWYPRWSPDGKTLCVQSVSEQPQCLLIYDFETKQTRKLLGEKWSVEYAGATWSPDGTQLVFVGKHNGREHLATADVARGEESVKVLYTENDPRHLLIGPPAWSPDGKQVVFAIQDTTRPDATRLQWGRSYLYSLSTKAPGKPVLLEGSEVGYINRGMMWSRDGETLIFSSER